MAEDYEYTSIGMSDALDLFDLERYVTGRYTEIPKGSQKSLLQCMEGLTLADIAAFKREELMREVERENGPHKQVFAWLKEPQVGLPDRRVCIGEFTVDWDASMTPKPRTATGAQLQPQIQHTQIPQSNNATSADFVRAEPSNEVKDRGNTMGSPSTFLSHRRGPSGGRISPTIHKVTEAPSVPAPEPPGTRRSPSPVLSRALPSVPSKPPITTSSPNVPAPVLSNSAPGSVHSISPRGAKSPPASRSPAAAKKEKKKDTRGDDSDSNMIKIVIVGGGGVGKSCITIQFMQRHFVTGYDPTVEDSYRKGLTIDDGNGHERSVLLDILDTAGQEEYSAMREQYMDSGEGFMLVFDLTSRDSFEELEDFHSQLKQVKDRDFVPAVVVGNKVDREEDREVSYEEGKALAEHWHCPYLEASAFSSVNVQESFETLVREIWKDREVNQRHVHQESSSNRFHCTML